MHKRASEDGVERETGAGRSWDVLDEEATKKACPKCSTKDLCTGWPEPKDKMSYPTSDMCIKGTVEGDADYNTITTMSLANQIFHSSSQWRNENFWTRMSHPNHPGSLTTLHKDERRQWP